MSSIEWDRARTHFLSLNCPGQDSLCGWVGSSDSRDLIG